MSVMIVGAGRVGVATAKIIRSLFQDTVILVDASALALKDAEEALTALPKRLDGDEMYVHAATMADLDAAIAEKKPEVVVCATPFSMNVKIAVLALKHGCHYMDFTEDVSVTGFITELPVGNLTFIPQTGLAPGLVNYLGLSLFEKLGHPRSLDLRVGALPQVAFGPEFYAITWSPEGLINEYIKPAFRKRHGVKEEVKPLSDLEHLLVNGVVYEGFTTAGGVGDLKAYEHIPNVEYKTLRHPGHLDFIKSRVLKYGLETPLEEGVANAKAVFNTTRDDVVVLAAYATDVDGKSASVGYHFKPDRLLGLTALELTTAGTGVAVLELLLKKQLPSGVLTPADIKISALSTTAAYKMVLALAQ